MKIVVASGFFAPAHKGHLAYLEAASKLGDKLFVIVNSDFQTKLKGSTPFMNEDERLEIVRAIRWVDLALIAGDSDRSVCKTLEYLHAMFGVNIFANGGDVNESNCREAEICRELGIKLVFGVGGSNKIQSSSKLIANLGRS